MRKFLLLIIILAFAVSGFSQDQSNKGKDFWLTYPAHNAGTASRMALYLTSDVSTTGMVQYNGNTITFSITANQTTVVRIGNATLPSNASCYIGTNNIVEVNKGIHITALKPIVAYAHILNSAVSGSTLLLPKNVLGREYIVSTHVPQGNTFNVEKCQFAIVGVEDNTTVEIIPINADISGVHPAKVPFQITLNRGDVYQFQSFNELSGSKVTSVSNGTSCKKIVVFGSTTRSALGCGAAGSGDNLFQQLTPVPSWGKNYITVPFILKNQDIIRAYVSNPLTPVILNGAPIPLASLINDSYYEFNANAAAQISSADGIAVYQYIMTQNCDNVQSDPEMILINSVEQTLSDITFVSAHQSLTPPNTNINSHYVNITLKNTGTALSSLRVDGAAPVAVFNAVGATNYVYARINLTASTTAANPSHRIVSDSGFIAIAYGYGNVESYGYNAGTYVKDLLTQTQVQSEYGIETTPSVCAGTPFKFKISLPYQPDSIQWNLSNLPAPTPQNVTTFPPPDSTTLVGVIPIYWYSLPLFYNVNTVGIYDIDITTFINAPSICGATQEISFPLEISAPPVPGFTEVIPRCYLEPVQFIETTPQTPKPTYKWYWDFGDGVTSTSKNPSHTYSAPGIYTVRFADITTPGCLSDTIQHNITIPDVPSATITGTNTVCLNDPAPHTITFTGSAGAPPYEFTYNINGTPQTPVISNAAGSYTIPVFTNVAGVFIYNLISVKNVGSTICIKNLTGQAATFTVNNLPVASIAGSATVCLNAPSPNVTFTGSASTAPYTFAYTINGIAQTPVTSNGAGVATIAAPTNTAGAFTYAITSVTDNSITLCTQAFNNVSTIINVNALPAAAITGTTSVCLNAASPVIMLSGSGGTSPYTFNYTINGVPQPAVISNAAGTFAISVPTTTANTFTYTVTSVQEGSATACIQSNVTGQSAIVTVNTLPIASITGAATVCLNASSPVITFTGSGSTAPYTFNYSINGIAQPPAISNAAGVATIAVPTNIAGVYNYAVTMVTDNSSTLCSQAYNNLSTVINVNALPTAVINGSAAVCLNATSPVITLSGSGGTAPYTFNYSINGVPQPAVVSNAAGNFSIAVPTNVANTFIYSLNSVQEGSANACLLSNITGQAVTVIVNPLPTASVGGATSVCLNAPSPIITFTGTGSIAPYTFNYTINGIAQTPVVSNAAGVATITAPTTIANNFVYALTSVSDASATTCSNNQNASTTIIVYPLPTPDFSFTAPACDTRVITFNDNSIPNVGTLTNWQWNFGDGNTATGTPVTHVYSGPGLYNAGLTVTTSNGCSNAVVFTKAVTINHRPQAGFTVPEVCINDVAAAFTDTSKITSGSISAAGYEWDYGDPGSGALNTSSAKDGAHLYTAVGVYTVRHIVTSSLGCKDTVYNNITINGADPVANFSVSNAAVLCANDSVGIINLSTISSGSITKVEIYWDVVGAPAVIEIDDFPSPGKIYKHKYPNFQSPLTRNFTIRLRAYSGTLCQDVKSTNIIVNAAPRVQFNAMPAACLDALPFQISQATEVGGVPGSFVYTGTGVSATGLFNPAMAGVGTHLIKYTFTSSAGGCVDTMSKPITVLDTASAKFSFINPVCEGTPSTFREESTAPAGVALSNTVWNFGDGSPLENHAPGTTFTHSFPGWGNYTVTMYNTSAYGCRSTSKVQQVFVSPIPNATFNAVQTSVCLPNAAVSFINNSSIADGSSMIYNWDFGDPASGPLNTSSSIVPAPHVYSGTGPYTVRLTATSSSNCAKVFTRIIDFIHPQPKTVFDFNKPEICIGDNVIFRDLTNGLDGTVVQWNWNFGDGLTGTNRQEQHLYTAAKTFSVSLFTVNSLGCNSDTLTQQFTVHPYPVVDAGPDRVVLEGGSISIQSNVTGNDLLYLWTPTTYLVSTTSANPTAVNLLDDITYTLTVTARGGCTSSDKMFVKVLKSPKVPNTFTPNNDGINDLWKIEYLDTYPNSKVQVFTRTGQLVFQSKGYKQPWDGTMNGKPLPFDTYYYIIEPENGRKPVTGYVTIVK